MEEQESLLTDIESNETEASSSQRFFVTVIDIIISIGLFLLIYKIIPTDVLLDIYSSSAISRYIFIFAVMELYRLILILVFGRTLGMMICSVKYLNAKLRPLTTKEKFIASVAIRTNSIRFYKN